MTEATNSTDKRPLIAHVIHRLKAGGMENGLINLVNHLSPAKYRHAIICLTESSDFENRIRAEDIQVYSLRKKSGKDVSVYVRFWRLLRKIRPAIVHTRNLGTLDLLLIAAVARVPIRVHGEHGWDITDPTGRSAKYRVLRRLCDRVVHGYVVVSKDIARWLEQEIGIAGNKIVQIYNGVDTGVFNPDGDTAGLPFNLPRSDIFVIGSVGRADPIKNYRWLINTYSGLLERQPKLAKKLRLVIIGEGAELAQMRQKVEAAGLQELVWLPGARNDIAELLRSFDIFILPSINEGISNTLLESMASALPAIASDVGGNGELVVNGETGFLFAVNDSETLMNAIEQYAASPSLRSAHGTASRCRAVRVFGLDTMMDAYTKNYEDLLRKQFGDREDTSKCAE